ncbi:ECF RNA polymerase sigma factor SigK [Amycolatopsis sp. NPDC059027]|uniref:ECF RNA polymerase sigma factor SigK n=1 Tax=unclassified Amycolatopsis TaxID=2618356 RepID=UPI00367333DA
MGERVGFSAPGNGERTAGTELAELVQRVGAGDEAAFSRLYDAVSGAVFGLAVRVMRDRAQAEEVAQEALVDVWRRAARYSPERGNVMAWVLMITHRRAVDRLRSESAADEREERAGVLDRQRPFDSVTESVLANLERERVRGCLSALTGLQRESIVLAYFNGYTYAEVAEVLRAPAGTVKTRIRDGLIRLRDCLGVGR